MGATIRLQPDAVASIDGQAVRVGTVRIDQQTEAIISASDLRPDPEWQHTDTASHFHAFTADGKLPTLRATLTHVPCDGSCGRGCEGYDENTYTCVICGEPVEPRWVDHGPRTELMPTTSTATVVALTDRPVRADQVSVRAELVDGELFGVGHVIEQQADSSGVQATIELRRFGMRGAR